MRQVLHSLRLFALLPLTVLVLAWPVAAQTPAPIEPPQAAAVQNPSPAGQPSEALPLESQAVVPPTAPAPKAAAPAVYAPQEYIPRAAIAMDGAVATTDALGLRSLLFKPDEVKALVGAMNRKMRGGGADGSDGGGLLAAGEDGSVSGGPVYPVIPTKRIIRLSGVAYRGPDDWVVWLNGHKLVPGKKLPEIVDIKVAQDRVSLKWFDIGMGKVIALTLRPYQTYDIVSGIMLSGPAAGQ